MDVDKKIAEWATTSAKMKSLKKKEMDLRVEIVSSFKDLNIGVNNLPEHGIKITAKQTVKIDEELLAHIHDDLNDDELACIGYRAYFKASSYDGIDHKTLDGCLTVTPSAPTMQIL